jgi:hypothetical protein
VYSKKEAIGRRHKRGSVCSDTLELFWIFHTHKVEIYINWFGGSSIIRNRQPRVSLRSPDHKKGRDTIVKSMRHTQSVLNVPSLMYSPVSKVVGHPQKHGKNAAVQAARKIQFFPSKFHHPESKNADSSEVSITRVRWQESGC